MKLLSRQDNKDVMVNLVKQVKYLIYSVSIEVSPV